MCRTLFYTTLLNKLSAEICCLSAKLRFYQPKSMIYRPNNNLSAKTTNKSAKYLVLSAEASSISANQKIVNHIIPSQTQVFASTFLHCKSNQCKSLKFYNLHQASQSQRTDNVLYCDTEDR